jgi:hypothetical protein
MGGDHDVDLKNHKEEGDYPQFRFHTILWLLSPGDHQLKKPEMNWNNIVT